MPHSNCWENDGLYRQFTGEISSAEILDSNLELQRHTRFEEIQYVINDFTEITDYAVEKSDTKIFVTFDDIASNVKHDLKIALVANQAPHRAIANNYCDEMKKKNKWECAVFYTIEDARKWVGNRPLRNLSSR